MKENTALITGASNGIGLHMARVFASYGHDLILVARNEQKLRSLAAQLKHDYKHFGLNIKVIVKDLARNNACELLFHQIRFEKIPVHILVNNAGIGDHGFFAEEDWSKIDHMLELNIKVLTKLCHLFSKEMIANGCGGKILNVASIAAFFPGPLMAVYYASKAYVLSFSEALANELRDKGISVSVLCPGMVRTDFHQNAGLDGAKILESGKVYEPGHIANEAYAGLMAGKVQIIPGISTKITAWGQRLLPRKIITYFVRKVQERRQRDR